MIAKETSQVTIGMQSVRLHDVHNPNQKASKKDTANHERHEPSGNLSLP